MFGQDCDANPFQMKSGRGSLFDSGDMDESSYFSARSTAFQDPRRGVASLPSVGQRRELKMENTQDPKSPDMFDGFDLIRKSRGDTFGRMGAGFGSLGDAFSDGSDHGFQSADCHVDARKSQEPVDDEHDDLGFFSLSSKRCKQKSQESALDDGGHRSALSSAFEGSFLEGATSKRVTPGAEGSRCLLDSDFDLEPEFFEFGGSKMRDIRCSKTTQSLKIQDDKNSPIHSELGVTTLRSSVPEPGVGSILGVERDDGQKITESGDTRTVSRGSLPGPWTVLGRLDTKRTVAMASQDTPSPETQYVNGCSEALWRRLRQEAKRMLREVRESRPIFAC